ncbi:MAG: DUF3575 domain-containing protein [Bacteroidota bacterium]|nr:DUF3575 domain-containing protein [Bacteroidota bacterium]
MRNICSLLLILFIAGQCMAQQKEEKAKPAFSSSGAVKWNPESLYFGKVGLSGEYNFKHKKSVTFGMGIPFNKALTYKLDNQDRSISMKTFSVMGGYRMYMGKKFMRGIYFEPYLKYLKNDASIIINADLNGRPVDFVTTSSYSGFGAGLQLGVQFMIAKRIVFDFFFLGPEANSVHHQAAMHDITSTSPWNAADAADAQQQINANIGDVPIIGKKLKVTVDANARTVSSDYKGFLPGFRAGLSAGVRF